MNAASSNVSAADFLPASHSLPNLREAARTCEGCELFRNATQTVFGEGTVKARLMLVGETPGDQEDLQGRPFVGPAGRLLDDAMARAGLERDNVYVTNVVKHFKWTPRGKRRLHAKPSAREITACRPWLEAEVAAVTPELVVCLGATAAQAFLGRTFRVTRQRGEVLPGVSVPRVLATHHPSAILRAPDDERRREMREEFVADLTIAANWLVTTSQ